MPLSPVLARTLAAGRPQFNARIAAARRARSGFDTDALSDMIRVRLDPVAAAVEAISPDRVGATVEAGFDLLVMLAGQAMAASRKALLDRVWSEVAPRLAAPVAGRPFATLGMLTNAALTIAATAGARADEWIERMIAVAPMIEADTLAATGQVIAWRSGMAHFREGALAAADGLPDALALAAIGASGRWAEVRAALVANPWWTPDEDTPCIRFGGFAGFGGPFAEPPRVRAGTQGFFVRSGERTGLLVADAWGATLHPAAKEEFDGADATGAEIRGGAVVAGDRTIPIDLPAEGLSAAIARNGIAIVSPYSHFVQILPWRLP